ncbi:hypothetical protein SJI19_16895 [Acerihabitans sp. TG2]|uniref:hypothetical protein n=1 Tax=Acerihabitans sp. TG2 TaxID=3096008 RepID=UPI002B228778|nr:hypothetical protein [Acerihabitans sp. TG2]MEA9392204.1 hypothetical protein [Acerihabitans sp. TG2]
MKSAKLNKNILALALFLAFPVVAATSSDTLLSNQSSAMESNLESEAATCATGDVAGTIGAAIKDAINAHTALAAATPNVESLFDVNSDCFSGASSLFDLSFAIPSLGSIIASAQDAVVKFAAKKVCTAVSQVSSLVTTPVNQAITKVKGYSSFADSAVGSGLSSVDPDIAKEYHTGNTNNYSVDVNPFNSTQSSVSSSTSSAAPVSSATSPSTSASDSSSSSGSSYVTSLSGLIK